MIFITVGTTNFPFRRMDSVVVRVKKEFVRERIIFQSNNTRLVSGDNLVVEKELGFGEFLKLLKKARVVVTHGGPATIYQALKYNRNKPCVVPRKKKYKEHVDDHQVFFVKFLDDNDSIHRVDLSDELLVSGVIDYCKKPHRKLWNGESGKLNRMITNLESYTSSIK